MDTSLLTLQTRELEVQTVSDTARRCGHCPGPSEQPWGPGTLMHLPTAPERGGGRGLPSGAGVSARGPSRPSLPSGTDPLSHLPRQGPRHVTPEPPSASGTEDQEQPQAGAGGLPHPGKHSPRQAWCGEGRREGTD